MMENFGAAEVLHLLNASRTNKTEYTCIVRVAQRRASAVLSIKVQYRVKDGKLQK